jgi:hypothetical protein
MPIRLSEEQHQEVAREGNRPIATVDPGTQKVYYLVAAEIFERVRTLLGDAFDIRDTYAAQDAALAKVWSDSELDAYADYDLHKSRP